MAWIAAIPPTARHPYERYQVRFQDGNHQRSAGIFPTKRRALAEKRAIERGDRQPLPDPADLDPRKARMPVGEYVTTKWWPAWKDQHPRSEYGTRKKGEKRILPTFGDIPSAIWTPAPSEPGRPLIAEGSRPAPSTPTCRCLAPSSTRRSTTTTWPARRCCERAAPVAPPRPAHRLGRHRTASGGSVHTPGRSQPRRDSLTFRGPRSSMRRPSSSAW